MGPHLDVGFFLVLLLLYSQIVHLYSSSLLKYLEFKFKTNPNGIC